MKKLLILPLILPFLLSANPTTEDQIFQSVKQMSLNMFNQQAQSIKMIRKCLKKADSKEDFARCMQIDPMITKYVETEGDDIEWNEMNKKQMIKDIDDGIKMMEGSKKCFETSTNMQSYEKCMKASGLDID